MERVFSAWKKALSGGAPLILAVIVLATVGLVNLSGMSTPTYVSILYWQQLLWVGLSILSGF